MVSLQFQSSCEFVHLAAIGYSISIPHRSPSFAMDLFRRIMKSFSESDDAEEPSKEDKQRRRSSKVVRILGQGRKINLSAPGGLAVSANSKFEKRMGMADLINIQTNVGLELHR